MLHAPNHASFTQNSTWLRFHSNNGFTLALTANPGQCTKNSIHGYMPELENRLEHALGLTTEVSQPLFIVCEYKCVCMHMNVHSQTHTSVCYPALPQEDTILTSSHYISQKRALIRAKINRTISASPHIDWPKEVRFDYSVDQQNHTYFPVFTGPVKTSCIGVSECLEQQNSLRSAHGQPKLA